MKIKSIVLIPLAIAVAQVAAAPLGGLNIISDLLKPGADEDIKIANGGPVGPGLSELVAIAEGILRKYGITKSFADIMDLDAGILAIASGILNINGKEGIIAAPGKLLGNSPPKTSKLDAANQKVLPTDIYKPIHPAAEQDGVKFHNVDVVSFLPGVVDETWIVAFGGKETHFGTNKACFSLSGPLQLSPDAIKTRCLSKDLSGENKGSPEEEKKPLKEEKCPPLALAGIAGGKVIVPSASVQPCEKIIACWGAIPDGFLPGPIPTYGKLPPPPPPPYGPNGAEPLNPPTDLDVTPPVPVAPTMPKYAILKFNGVLRQE